MMVFFLRSSFRCIILPICLEVRLTKDSGILVHAPQSTVRSIRCTVSTALGDSFVYYLLLQLNHLLRMLYSRPRNIRPSKSLEMQEKTIVTKVPRKDEAEESNGDPVCELAGPTSSEEPKGIPLTQFLLTCNKYPKK